ncbi:hypothetical protein C8F01DRAFT_1368676 [Mycena amicta]|nr:hypothetical protein C8F01DRAFT_1368676 [Mycena amicta]
MSTSQFPSKVLQKSSSWQGLDSLKFLIIFRLRLFIARSNAKQPSRHPIPGDTYTEFPELPNWVGHLIKTHAPENDWLVFDYAVGGARVHDVGHQVRLGFEKDIADGPSHAEWSPNDSLFVTWVGINDSAYTSEHAENMAKLFAAQEKLYNRGARNFLFINIPPIDRAPAHGHEANYINWNTELDKAAASFAAAHSDCTVMIFSAWETFHALLDDPVAHGFRAGDESKAYGSVWVDYLHPTSRVHDFVALDVVVFLTGGQ